MTDDKDYRHDLFISYNRADEEWARKLATRVEQEEWRGGKLRVFFALWDIKPGESVDERLDRALSESRYVGLVLSPESVESQWVSEEWYSTHHAGMKRKERRLIPLYLKSCEIPRFIDHLNRIDFRDEDKFDDGLRLLLAVLREEPLPRGETRDTPKDAAPPPPIPRPPVIGFVARRDAEGRDIVARLKEELAPGRNQLVTLSGPGGIGKTTLAAETARGLQTAYNNRIVWSSADGRTDFSFLTLLDEIATQLGRADLRTLAPAAKEEQVRALVAAPLALVVLDNYETIVEAERKRIEAWFTTAQCSALFTSRPHVDGTKLIKVSAMSRDEAAEFLEKFITEQTREPQMFSADVRERIYVTADANPFVMQWVVKQIDGALEPDTVFEELAEGDSDAARRVFDRSFNLLNEDARAVLLAVSLFAPSASREAPAAVAGFGDDWKKRMNESVKNLHALWLVKGVDGNRRLAVEGLTRTLAAAHLSKDPRADEFRRRFVAYFLSYAIEHKEWTPENYDALEEDRDNLLRAADAAFASEDWGSVMRMAYILVPHGMLYVRGYWDEAVRLSAQALKAAHSSQDEARIADLSHNIAIMYLSRGEVREARRLYEESLEIDKKLGNQRGVANSFGQLGNLALKQGDAAEAQRLYNSCLKISRELGDQNSVAITLHHLGLLAYEQNELAEARRLYDESLEIKRRLGDLGSIALTVWGLGNISLSQRHFDEAKRMFQEALETFKRLGDQANIAGALHQLARVAEKENDKAEAARLFREALSIFERLGSPDAEVARQSLARVEGEGG